MDTFSDAGNKLAEEANEAEAGAELVTRLTNQADLVANI